MYETIVSTFSRSGLLISFYLRLTIPPSLVLIVLQIDIQLGQFIRGYSEGRIHENGWPEMLKLKDWPSPSASEEFLLYQRPEFISKLPLLEFIHSKWGLLNVAAKLPHYSLQNDVGPKIFISYGMYEELGRGDSVNNLHISMRDLVSTIISFSCHPYFDKIVSCGCLKSMPCDMQGNLISTMRMTCTRTWQCICELNLQDHLFFSVVKLLKL